MKIELTGNLDPELTALGLKPGQIVDASKCPVSKTGVMHFSVYKSAVTVECSVWPENYKIAEDQK